MAHIRFLLAALLMAGSATADIPEPDFRETLRIHLDAITGRDLATFESTLTGNDDLMVIFPDGAALDSTQAVVDFHREWFSDPKWVMEPEVVKTIEGTDQSTALVRYQYRDTPDGQPRSAWLVLVFTLEDGQWRLVHDQNTRIEPEP